MNHALDKKGSGAAGFIGSEDGGGTAYGVLLFTCMAMIGGVAVDVAHLNSARIQLQIAADTAAHAAIVERSRSDPEQAIQRALEIAEGNMPSGRYGNVLQMSNIRFGTWDADALSFIDDAQDGRDVHVTVEQRTATGNAVPTFLMNMVGIDRWDIQARSVLATRSSNEVEGCFSEGFVAHGSVRFTSNNSFLNGFCIHSNSEVWLRQHNYFEEGTRVSIPDISMLDTPGRGFGNNPGLEEALDFRELSIPILDDLEDIIDALGTFGSAHMPDYITGALVVDIEPSNNMRASDFTPGRIHRADCGGNGKIGLRNGEHLSNIVLVTDCQIDLGNDTILESAVLATTNTGSHSVTGSPRARIGNVADCDGPGGAQILTLGGFHAPAHLEVRGGQVIARGDIFFAAQGNGMNGAAFVAGGDIRSTANMTMSHCGGGMDDNFMPEPEADGFRIVL